MADARKIAGRVLLAAAAAGLGYTALAIAGVRKFRGLTPEVPADTPPITIFKPLHGDEPDLEENLRSFCDQRYPEFQVIFSAADEHDPALDVARRVAAQFTNRDVRIVAGTARSAPNPKMANVLGAYPVALHDILVVADSDIRVDPEYLRAIAAGFADSRTGAVTCLYGAIPNASIASTLGAMRINDAFAPSVLVAQVLEPLQYCFGATMAVRRSVLEEAGGFEAFARHLGDDYLLGNAVTRKGYRVALSPYVVRTVISETTLEALWRRELRWSRTILAARPAGFAGSVVTYPLALAVFGALLTPSRASAAVLLAAAFLRTLLHYEARRTFAPEAPAAPWLLLPRDLLELAEWAASFGAGRVRWRAAEYRLEAGGRMAADPKEL